MRGIVFRGDRTVELETVPDPTPGMGEVVLEIEASGMCGSDLKYYRQPSDPSRAAVIGGHEPAGVVVAIGPGATGPHARLGARVMVHHYHACTGCGHCRAGWPQMCRTVPIKVYGANAHGAHAPFMAVPANTLVPLDEALSFAAGAAIACGTGTAWGALERMGLTGRDTVAIFGQGPVGLSATMLAKAMGARVVALDIDASRRALAACLGADLVVDPADADVPGILRDATCGAGVTQALETSGAASAGQDAIRSVAPWGTVCLVGLSSQVTVSVGELLRSQIRVLTSWTMSIQGQRACADFAVERGLPLDALFTDRWSLEEAEAAYRAFDRQSGGKGVFLRGGPRSDAKPGAPG